MLAKAVSQDVVSGLNGRMRSRNGQEVGARLHNLSERQGVLKFTHVTELVNKFCTSYEINNTGGGGMYYCEGIQLGYNKTFSKCTCVGWCLNREVDGIMLFLTPVVHGITNCVLFNHKLVLFTSNN